MFDYVDDEEIKELLEDCEQDEVKTQQTKTNKQL